MTKYANKYESLIILMTFLVLNKIKNIDTINIDTIAYLLKVINHTKNPIMINIKHVIYT